ncbi:MAG: CBS domain-containing protein [Dokdonella sp.]
MAAAIAQSAGDPMKKVSEVMTTDVRLGRPDQTIREVAVLMMEADIGSLPIEDHDRLVGMVTDRDIVLRAVALGLGAETLVREVMSEDVKYCFDDESVAAVADNMAKLGLRRLPVIDRNKRLVGIVALSNIAQSGNETATESLLKGVAQPH